MKNIGNRHIALCHHARLLSLACSMFAAVLCMRFIAASAEPDTGEWNLWAWNYLNETIPVQPLDHPSNPWRGQYSEFDLWVIEHSDPVLTPQLVDGWYLGLADAETKPLPAGDEELSLQIYTLWVSAEGFVVPSGSLYRPLADEPRLRDLIEKKRFNRPEDFRINARGQLTPELHKIYISGFVSAEPELKYAIPAWLAAEPPLLWGFTPEGHVLVKGLLGVANAEETDRRRAMLYAGIGTRWYRYSLQGELLDSFLAEDLGGLPLFDAYWQGSPLQERYPSDDKTLVPSYFGEIVFIVRQQQDRDWQWDRESGEVVAAFDYTGRELDINAPYGKDPLNGAWGIDAVKLAELWQKQQQNGTPEDAGPSPFDGQPNGPQRFKAEPPARLITAQFPTEEKTHFSRGGSGRTENIFVANLDDPANPWRGQYDWVDLWIYENANRLEAAEEPSEQYDQSMLYRQRAMLVAEARAAGMSRDDFYVKYEKHPAVGYAWKPDTDPPSDWRVLTGYADSDGFMVPLREITRRQLLAGPSGIYSADGKRGGWPESAILYAGGRMSEEQYAQYQELRRSYTVDLEPEIPDWLAAAPPLRATLGPNGEWITIGALGSFSAGDNVDARLKEWRKGERTMQRYSAEGQLLESAGVEGDNWMEVYVPQFVRELKAKYSDQQRYVIYPWYGYIAVQQFERQPLPPDLLADNPGALGMVTSGRLIELYDYLGNPLPLETEILREGWIGYQLYGHEIAGKHAAQQALQN